MRSCLCSLNFPVDEGEGPALTAEDYGILEGELEKRVALERVLFVVKCWALQKYFCPAGGEIDLGNLILTKASYKF